MNVQDTIATALRCYPSLYSTRVDVLCEMFSSTNYYWKDGELIHSDYLDVEECLERHSREDAAELARLQSEIVQAEASGDAWDIARGTSRLLEAMRRHAMEKFTRDNASLLSRDINSKLSHVPMLMFFDNFKIPVEASEEWHLAARELAKAVLDFKIVPVPRPTFYDNHISRSQTFARAFYDAPQDFNPSHQTAITALKEQADLLGMEVVEKK